MFADRVKDTTTSTGTGNVTLSGTAPTGFVSFNTAFGTGTTFYYCIEDGTNWEVGIGTLSASTTLVRSTILASSNAGSAVNFGAGTKNVFNTVPSSYLSGPDSFTFTPVTGAMLVATVESNQVTLSGDASAVWPLVIRGDGSPQLQVAGGPWGVSDNARTGDTLKLRLTAANAGLTLRTATVYAPGRSVVFDVTTAAVSWTPSLLADLEYWWDAADVGAATLSGTTLTSYADKAGAGNWTPFGTGPTAVEAEINGLRVFRFPNANGLQSPTSISLGDFVFFAVFKPRISNQSYERVVDHDFANGFWFGRNDNNAAFGGGIQEGSPPYGQFISLANGTTGLYGYGRTGTTRNIWTYGDWANRLSGTVSNTATTSNRIGIGAYHNNGNVAQSAQDIDICEVFICSAWLSTNDRQKAEGYLAHKWGLAGSLPNDHPYKNSAP